MNSERLLEAASTFRLAARCLRKANDANEAAVGNGWPELIRWAEQLETESRVFTRAYNAVRLEESEQGGEL